MAEEKVVEKHEHTRTETDEGASESRRDTVVERDRGGDSETVTKKERTVEEHD